MKVFKSENPRLVLVFDYLTGKNSSNLYSENSKLQIEPDVEMSLNIIKNDYYELSVALREFNPDEIDVIILMPTEFKNKSDKTKFNYIDDMKLDLYSELIVYDTEKTILMPLGKFSLYALTGLKDIVGQAGKERNTVIDLTTLLDKEDIKGYAKKDLIYKYRTIPNYNPAYLFYNRAVVNNFYFIFNLVRKILNNEDLEEKETKTFETEEEALQFIDDLLSKKDEIQHIYFDIETEDLTLSKVLGVSIDYDGNKIPVYIPIFSRSIIQKISELLKTYSIVGHNLKFDMQQLIYNGFIKEGEYNIKDDTYILGHLIYNKTLGGLSLKHLAKTLIGVVEDWDNAIKEYMRKNKLKSFKDIPLNILGKYASLDAYYTKKLYNRLMTEYKSEYDYLKNQYKEILNMVMNWELKGVKINLDKLEELDNFIIPKIENSIKTIRQLPSIQSFERDKKKKFNVNSVPQLSEVVKDYLKISEAKKTTKSGSLKLDREELTNLYEIYKNMHSALPENKQIQEKYTFLKSLLDYKLYDKFVKSYIKPLKKSVDDFGIFRVDYNIGGTITGRLSSFFHTLPSRTELGKNFKMLVEARQKDYVIVSLDISQLEPRIMASLSNDEHLIEAYNTGKDLYKYMASKVFSIPYDEVPKDKRNQMKTLVLAILYGMSASSLAKKLEISKKEAEEIMVNFFKEFPDIASWRDEQFFKVKQNRKVITALGREIPITNESDEEIRKISVNYQIQSTASELALIIFKEVDKILKNHTKSFTIGGVHDSLIIETHISEISEVLRLVKTYIEEVAYHQFDFLKVKLKIDMNVGISWGNSLEVLEMSDNELLLEGYTEDLMQLSRKLIEYNLLKDIEKLEEYKVDISEESLRKVPLYGKYKLNLEKI